MYVHYWFGPPTYACQQHSSLDHTLNRHLVHHQRLQSHAKTHGKFLSLRHLSLFQANLPSNQGRSCKPRLLIQRLIGTLLLVYKYLRLVWVSCSSSWVVISRPHGLHSSCCSEPYGRRHGPKIDHYCPDLLPKTNTPKINDLGYGLWILFGEVLR